MYRVIKVIISLMKPEFIILEFPMKLCVHRKPLIFLRETTLYRSCFLHVETSFAGAIRETVLDVIGEYFTIFSVTMIEMFCFFFAGDC